MFLELQPLGGGLFFLYTLYKPRRRGRESISTGRLASGWVTLPYKVKYIGARLAQWANGTRASAAHQRGGAIFENVHGLAAGLAVTGVVWVTCGSATQRALSRAVKDLNGGHRFWWGDWVWGAIEFGGDWVWGATEFWGPELN